MSVTASDFQNLIITSLSNADPTALAGLTTNVPKYWLLYARSGYIPELRYWLTRREAIRYLQACLTQEIDYMRRSQAASRTMTESSRQDTNMSASASETASSLANRTSSSHYTSATNSSGSGSSSLNRSAYQTMSDHASMSDTGSGANSASRTSTLASSSTVNASSSDSTATQRRQAREVTGAVAHLNGAKKFSSGFSVGIGETTTESGTYESYDPSNNTITECVVGAGNSSFSAVQSDYRVNSSLQTSDQSSSSYFNANRTSSDVMSANGASAMSSASSSAFSLTGSGSGTMLGAGAGSSTMTGASTRTETGSGEAHRLSNSASTMTSTLEKLHQRFLHLQEMWKKANDMIIWFEKQRLNLAPYVFQAITIQYPAGLNAAAANAFLIKDPFGDTIARPPK